MFFGKNVWFILIQIMKGYILFTFIPIFFLSKKVILFVFPQDRLKDIPEIQLFGDPLASIVAFKSDVVDILEVGAILVERGWHLNFIQHPPGWVFGRFTPCWVGWVYGWPFNTREGSA